MKLDDLDVFTMTDQPETCPMCGARTEFLEMPTRKQVHVCLNCKEVFVVEE